MDSFISEINHLLNEVGTRTSGATPEARRKRSPDHFRSLLLNKPCTHKLKSLLFEEQHLDLLETALSAVTRQPNHPLQQPLQQALHNRLSSEEGLKDALQHAQYSPTPLFAEAFNHPSVLTRWQNIIGSSTPVSEALKRHLVNRSACSLSLPLKQFADLSLNTNQELTLDEQRQKLAEILKQLTPHDWKILQEILPEDRSLLNNLFFPGESKAKG